MLDHWLSICIFTPIVVAYWRGTWQLLDLYLWPLSEPCLNAITSFTIGVVTIIILTMAQTLLTKNITTERLGKATFFIVSRFYTVLFAFVGVNHWRGVWYIMSCHAGEHWWNAGCAVAIAATTLACLRTVAVVGSLVVVVWWGLWTLLDILVFPESLFWSATTGVFIGIGLAIACFILQSLVAYCSRNSPYWLRIIVEDIFLFVAEVAAISLWRGIWNLLDIFFIPDDPFLSNTLTSFTGMSLLIMMYNSNSILVKGILFNLHLKDGSGCHFRIIMELCNAVKLNKMKKYEAHKETGNLQNYNWKEPCDFNNYDTSESLWIPQVKYSVHTFGFFDVNKMLKLNCCFRMFSGSECNKS
uniref:Uncharacterized protein n=1 Tax=Strigamia maritima TaxID=126957 RepID=T1IPR0_STRMM